MDPNKPQRIQLPEYYNTPLRKDYRLNMTKYIAMKKDRSGNEKYGSYINHSSALNMSYSDQADRIISQKRLKDYTLLAFACKRGNLLRVTHF